MVVYGRLGSQPANKSSPKAEKQPKTQTTKNILNKNPKPLSLRQDNRKRYSLKKE
jgi:hypothetical protein